MSRRTVWKEDEIATGETLAQAWERLTGGRLDLGRALYEEVRGDGTRYVYRSGWWCLVAQAGYCEIGRDEVEAAGGNPASSGT